MTQEREHRLEDRKVGHFLDELEQSDPDFDVPGKQTRAELLDRIAAMSGVFAPPRSHAGPGRGSARALKWGFFDYQALALRDVLTRLGDRHALRAQTLAAADPRVAKRVRESAMGGRPSEDRAQATAHGHGLWQAAQRRAVTLYRRASHAGAVSTRSSEVDAAVAGIGSGAPLPRHICQLMEPIYGMRLDRVRIHTGSVAQRACDAVCADAFTVGEDVFLPGWDPHSLKCRELLAHELVHCVQWWQGRIAPSATCTVSRPTDALEQEAYQFVRGIRFDQLTRVDSLPSRSGTRQFPDAHAHGNATATAPTLQTPSAPRFAQLVMRSADKTRLDPYGLPVEGTETWDSANWQFWLALGKSMWGAPIGKVLRRHAEAIYGNAGWVLAGITLALLNARLAIVATGIVGALAAITAWLTSWGLPIFLVEKEVLEWFAQVEKAKYGDAKEAALAKEKCAEAAVAIALFWARAKAGKSGQSEARSATGKTERSAGPARAQLEAPAAANAGAAAQLPAPIVPAARTQLPAPPSRNLKTQLPAVGATTSLFGPPTEQQFLDQHPLAFGSPEPGEFGQPSPNTDAVTALIKRADKVTVFLDYDGTLVPLQNDPAACAPSPRVLNILTKLSSNPRFTVIIISGRSRGDLERFVGHLPIRLIGEHGVWTREATVGGEWTVENLSTEWKPPVLKVMNDFANNKESETYTPGSKIEEKDFGIAWHYRTADDPTLGKSNSEKLKAALGDIASSHGLEVQMGNHVVEVKLGKVNKGTSASRFVDSAPGVVHIGVGDDKTDEALLAQLKKSAQRSVTAKVGEAPSVADYRLEDPDSVLSFLEKLAD